MPLVDLHEDTDHLRTYFALKACFTLREHLKGLHKVYIDVWPLLNIAHPTSIHFAVNFVEKQADRFSLYHC